MALNPVEIIVLPLVDWWAIRGRVVGRGGSRVGVGGGRPQLGSAMRAMTGEGRAGRYGDAQTVNSITYMAVHVGAREEGEGGGEEGGGVGG